MSRLHRVVAARLSQVLLAGGVVALAYAAYLMVDARAFQANARRRFEEAKPISAVESVPVDGDSIGEIAIPRLGISVMVVQGDSPAILQRAVGHIVDTALPGQTGNVVLAGHRDTFFRPLKDVRVGDTIAITTAKGDFIYAVESTVVVPPDDVRVLAPTGEPTLTLITCFPFYYVGPAPNRFIVRARETNSPQRR